MTKTPFSVAIRSADNGVRHVVVSGELDVSTVPEIEARLPGVVAGAECVVLDMSGLSFLDSTGIRFLVRLDAAAGAQGWTLRLVPGPADVQRALRIVGLEERLPFLSAGGPLAD